MGYCCVPNCRNSTKKGFLMKSIPRNPNRRAVWIKNIGRKNWNPTDRTYICEVHFEPYMWEKPRVDGKRILKLRAVPTLFSTCSQDSNKQDINQEQVSSCEILREDCYSSDDGVERHLTEILSTPSVSTEISSTSPNEISSTSNTLAKASNPITSEKILSTPSTLTAPPKTIFLTRNTEDQLKYLVKRNKQLENRMKVYKKKLLACIQLQKNNGKTQERNEYKEILKSMFNDDQIQYLCAKHYNKKRIKNWSNSTIKEALKLKLICGTNGYEELLKQKLPLPSLRTLRSRMESFKFEGDIKDDV